MLPSKCLTSVQPDIVGKFMSSLWPWLAVAGVGALHGLNPATGWTFAAAWGVRSRDRSQALRALIPIGVGHALSVALVACAVALGLSRDRALLQAVAAVLFVVVAGCVVSSRRTEGRSLVPTGHVGLALWSFIMSTVHGAGLMLVPALVPLCIGNAPGREITATGSMTLALAVVGIHTASMLVATGAMSLGSCHGFDAIAKKMRVHG
jgi:hypothetical protein